MATNGVTNPAFDEEEGDKETPLEDTTENNEDEQTEELKTNPSKLTKQPVAINPVSPDISSGTTRSDNTDVQAAQYHEDQVSMWKDHSQTAATTSLSIVQVALLKAVLDLDPDQNENYYVTLTFIIINIVLSITSGALVLVLYVIRYSLSKVVRSLDVPNEKQISQLEAMNQDTEANVAGTAEQEVDTTDGTGSQEASTKRIPSRSYSEVYSSLCMQELALQMLLADLLEEDDESEEHQRKLSSVLKRLRSIKRQRSLVRYNTVKQKQESHRTCTAWIQTAITLMMFLSTIANMFVVIFGFTADEGSIGDIFTSLNSSFNNNLGNRVI